MQILEDAQANVEPNQIDQLKRTHRMVQTQPHRLVDVLSRGDALLEHVESLIADQGVNAAGDEAGRFAHHDHFLAHAVAYLAASGQGVLRGLQCAHNFQQLHLGHWIKKVHAHTLLRAAGDRGNLRDRKRGGIAGENCARLGEFVQNTKNIDFELHLLRRGLDYQVGLAAGLLNRTGASQARERLLLLQRGDFAAGDALLERLANVCQSLLQHRSGYILQNRAVATQPSSDWHTFATRSRTYANRSSAGWLLHDF